MTRWTAFHRWAPALAVLLCHTPARGQREDFFKTLERGEIVVYTRSFKGVDTPELVAKALVNAPPERVWEIVQDCGNFKRTMPRIKASKLVSRSGKKVICQVTVDMPFPYSDTTSVTEAIHIAGPERWSRTWKLLSGDYKLNQGSWLLRPYRGDVRRTYVVYRILAQPKAWIPGWIRKAAQKRSIPKMIRRIRELAKKPQKKPQGGGNR
jgi:ribosome-associated toxin RatA of RatAB toxin-antitoxin module